MQHIGAGRKDTSQYIKMTYKKTLQFALEVMSTGLGSREQLL